MKFIHEAHPVRAVFGDGERVRVGEEAERLGIARAFVITSPRIASIFPHAAATFTQAVAHVPIETVRRARGMLIEVNADGLVAIGGGSTIGLAKALALESGLSILAVPTTYCGSEMSAIWDLTQNGEKRTGRDARVRPRTVIYDPELTKTMPADLAAQSGLNALAHAMEALYAPGIDPMTLLLAEEAARAISTHLTTENTAGVLYGAWLAGICLDRATMGLHHKLCHVLGSAFNLPHAGVHSVMLPHVATFNREAAPDAMLRLARGLRAGDAPAGLFALAKKLGVPSTLSQLGMQRSDIDRAAELATANAYANPRPVDRESVRRLLEAAFG